MEHNNYYSTKLFDINNNSGPSGTSGPSGSSGPSGPSGPSGSSGPSGITGSTNVEVNICKNIMKKELEDTKKIMKLFMHMP